MHGFQREQPHATRRTVLQQSGLAAALLAMGGACGRSRPTVDEGDLGRIDAVETARRIASGELSASVSVEAAIQRAERINPRINAIAAETFAMARERAAAASAGPPAGPLAGVATFVKDLDDLPAVSTGFGSRAFPGYKGSAASPFITRYLELGVISLGKSTTPEFGLTATTEPVSTGETRNPWNLEFSTGGSSGGAAALVASGVVPIAHASDGGGSIRIPAACCGLVGLKVSRGRNPVSRPEPGRLSLAVHGAHTRTVRDTAAVAAWLETAGEGDGLKPVGIVSGPSSRRLRIGLLTEAVPGRPVDRAVVDAVVAAGLLCEQLGHQVGEAATIYSQTAEDDFLLRWAAAAHGAVMVWEERTKLPRNPLAFERFTLGLASYFEARRDDFEPAVDRLLGLAPLYADAYADFDVILSPVLAAPPARIGYLSGKLDFETMLERVRVYAPFTGLQNVVGAPAISLPLAMSQDGVPIGVMAAAHIGEERTLLELAFELEDAAPWRDRRPAVYA